VPTVTYYYDVGTLAVQQEGNGWLSTPLSLLLAVPDVKALSVTASVSMSSH